ncbi:hypothetical protein U9M48_025672 [Paspalum notatum var. saurae]|uniref:Uncharacterized protein n=1 Tax=Paspalum notatum var. saurae TaxID=547442 RepID=A0AAQ3WXB9_PASNO
MLNTETKLRLSNVDGISPVRLLLDKSSTCRFVRLQMDEGICPFKLLELASIGEVDLEKLSSEVVIHEVDHYELPIHVVKVQIKFLQSLELTYGIGYLTTEFVFSEIKNDQISKFGYMCAIKCSIVEKFIRECPTEIVVVSLEYSEQRAITNP